MSAKFFQSKISEMTDHQRKTMALTSTWLPLMVIAATAYLSVYERTIKPYFMMLDGEELMAATREYEQIKRDVISLKKEGFSDEMSERISRFAIRAISVAAGLTESAEIGKELSTEGHLKLLSYMDNVIMATPELRTHAPEVISNIQAHIAIQVASGG